MERIQALISKLNEQAEQGADTTDMLATVTRLHNELLSQQSARRLGTSKVAVVMPAGVSVQQAPAAAAEVRQVQPAVEVYQEPVVAQVVDAGQYERYAPRPNEKTVQAQPVTVKEEPVARQVEKFVVVEEKRTIAFAQQASSYQQTVQHEIVSDPLNEIPTLSHQVNKSDESINDKLKQVKTELAEMFKDIPVKDLRKAIGINDRFVFINDLFRGDEAMYERSIKTINGFNIFPEADYWISRELKVKLGWDNDHPLVLQFDQLVKRRFS
ncbi:hypothetical protein LZZ85_16440 [Terrimonas sp. NA20]|uniref:Uncharacterized protein n=1 Tax=Terrimonas ginsenosidimutans TaxID=2908004 RepID=A0ABS9KU73_9BACT|nr:hypothetical protein [Terrimonas ginsenosidimutans]MCG2615886.1 hypothetical protein [Terrimonas ginsenosidimutans]